MIFRAKCCKKKLTERKWKTAYIWIKIEKYCNTYDRYQCLLKYFLHLSSTFWTSKFKKEIDLFVPLSNCEFLQEKETYLVHLILIKPQNLDHYARTTCPPAWNLKNDGNHNTCKMVKRSSFKKAKVFFAKALLYIREMFQNILYENY